MAAENQEVFFSRHDLIKANVFDPALVLAVEAGSRTDRLLVVRCVLLPLLFGVRFAYQVEEHGLPEDINYGCVPQIGPKYVEPIHYDATDEIGHRLTSMLFLPTAKVMRGPHGVENPIGRMDGLVGKDSDGEGLVPAWINLDDSELA